MQKDWSEGYMLRNLLHTMLCEEAILHKASSIFVFKPGIGSPRSAVISLGQHKIEVQIVTANKNNKFNDWFAWAVSVDLADGASSEFEDFCISILDGYGWNYRGRHDKALLFEDQGEILFIWAANNFDTIISVISEASSYAPEMSIIITPINVNKKIFNQALDAGWTLVHYSEIGKYLYNAFKSTRFFLSD